MSANANATSTEEIEELLKPFFFQTVFFLVRDWLCKIAEDKLWESIYPAYLDHLPQPYLPCRFRSNIKIYPTTIIPKFMQLQSSKLHATLCPPCQQPDQPLGPLGLIYIFPYGYLTLWYSNRAEKKSNMLNSVSIIEENTCKTLLQVKSCASPPGRALLPSLNPWGSMKRCTLHLICKQVP